MRFSWEFPSSSTLLLCIPASLNVPAGSGEPCLPQNSWTTPLQHLAGSNMIAISWTPSRDRDRALARYFLGSEASSCLHEFLKQLFPSLSSGTDTDLRQLPTSRRATGQENTWCGDKPWIPWRRATLFSQDIMTWAGDTIPNLGFGFVCTC